MNGLLLQNCSSEQQQHSMLIHHVNSQDHHHIYKFEHNNIENSDDAATVVSHFSRQESTTVKEANFLINLNASMTTSGSGGTNEANFESNPYKMNKKMSTFDIS